MNLETQIKCATRELALRKAVYPKLIALGKMSETAATAETEAIAAILETLKACQLMPEQRKFLEQQQRDNRKP